MKRWVFDLDGTLVDSFGHYFAILQTIFSSRGLEFGDADRLPALTEPLDRLFERKLGPDSVAKAFEELRAQSLEDAQSIRPFAGIPEVLDSLTRSGSRVAVFTNRDLPSATLILKHSGLSPYVET